MATLDRPKIEYRTPPDLVKQVMSGRLRLPSFQRKFKWGSGDVIALFDSLWRGFPIGNLLLWLRPAPAARVQVGPISIDAPELDLAYWVVDGQQRITSLVGALTAAETATDPRFRIYLDLEKAEFHSLGARQQAPRHWLPVNRLTDTSGVLAWGRENLDWLTDELIAVADSAAQAIREYQIPTYVVTTDDEVPLRMIFDRLNNTGKPMTKAEVFHALHSGMGGDEPDNLRDIGGAPADVGFGRIDERLALRCVLAYRGGDVFREDFQEEFLSDDDRRTTFKEVSTLLREVVRFLRGEVGIPHIRVLPYGHVLPVLTRFFKLHGEPHGRVGRLLRRWVWRDAVSGSLVRATSVAAVRQAVVTVDVDDPYEAAERLARGVAQPAAIAPQLDKVHLGHAAAKINLLGMLSAGPRDLATGAPLDLAAIFNEATPVRAIVPDSAGPLAKTFANRIVAAPSFQVRNLLVAAPEPVARSHLLDAQAQRLLAAGDYDSFLTHRAGLVGRIVGSHVASMVEWGARDGRAVSEMMRSAA